LGKGVSSWQSSVEREVGVGVTVVSTHNNLGISLPCNVCHVTKTVLLTKTLPPDALKKRLQSKGWRLGNRGQTCPECIATRPNANKRTTLLSSGSSNLGYAPPMPVQAASPPPTRAQRVHALGQLDKLFKEVDKLVGHVAKSEAPAPAPAVVTPPAPAPAPAPAVVTPPAPQATPAPARTLSRPTAGKTNSAGAVAPAPKEITQVATAPAVTQPQAEPTEAAKLAHRRVMQLLEDYYIGQQGRYVNNEWDDARVAAESGGASLASVIQVREKWFGTLRENPELTALRAEVVVVASEMEALLGQVDQVEQDARAAVAQLRLLAEQVQAKLDKLTTRVNKLS
jgi:hypothetical protein